MVVDGVEEEKRETVYVFSECPYKIMLKDYEKTGLDVIFYGQNNCDTMANIMDKDIKNDEILKLEESQKLISNKDLMSKNFKEVIDNLSECESYIQDVLDDKIEGDSELGRLLEDCLGQFSTDDMNLLDSLVASNFEDALLISSLTKLQSH